MLPFLKSILLAGVLFANVTDDMRMKPLPAELHPGASALDYHDVPVAVSSAANKEPLVDLRAYGIAGAQYYARTDGLNPPYYRTICNHDNGRLLCRKTVAEKLKRVNEHLRPYGVELYVYDAYRPIECQRSLWTYFVKVAGDKAGNYCSDPRSFNESDVHTWPIHTTGGAVDLTLRALSTRELLYMGTVFDEASPASITNTFEANAGDDDSASLIEAKRNRRLLYWAMHSEGFTNYPYEWWHFDYGTQMWVKNSNQINRPVATAMYGYAGPLIRTHQKTYTARPRGR